MYNQKWRLMMLYFGIVLLIIVFYLLSGLRIVHQSEMAVVEFLGKYNKTWNAGLHWFLVGFYRIANRVSLKERILDSKPQPVITKDNVTMQIDAVLFYRVVDVHKFTYGIQNYRAAIENLTSTTLRNIIGELELDETLTSRDVVNAKMKNIIDDATTPWGIDVTRVELKNILPPRDIQDSMEKQMRAERERREAILRAEGEKKSSVLIAEGEKQAKILRAEADKETKVLQAQADKEAMILRGEAERAATIAVAEGQKQAIEYINKAMPGGEYLQLQGLEALKALADGNATKIIVPSEIQNLSGLITSVVEVAKTDNVAKKPVKIAPKAPVKKDDKK